MFFTKKIFTAITLLWLIATFTVETQANISISAPGQRWENLKKNAQATKKLIPKFVTKALEKGPSGLFNEGVAVTTNNWDRAAVFLVSGTTAYRAGLHFTIYKINGSWWQLNLNSKKTSFVVAAATTLLHHIMTR